MIRKVMFLSTFLYTTLPYLDDLRTFALIVSVHPYHACNSHYDVMPCHA